MSPEQLQKDTINDQSAYLNDFAEISRNRGKAFDYSKPSWNTQNVSGFEKRVSMLPGIDSYERRHLCNVEVTPCFRLQLKDEKGNLLIKSSRSYDSRELFMRTASKMLNQLRDPSTYGEVNRKVAHFDSGIARRLFSAIPSDENIIISKYKYHQELFDSNNEVVAINENTKFNSPEEAVEKKDEFIKNIDKQAIKKEKENNLPYRLLPIDGREDYLDFNAFEVNVTKYSWWKWKFNNPDTEEKLKSENAFATEEEAWEDAVENAELGTFVTEFEEATSLSVVVNDVVTLTGYRLYLDREMATATWEDVKILAQNAENYSYEKLDESIFKVALQTKKQIIAVSQEINLEVFDPDATIKVCAKAFTEENLKPKYANVYQVYGFKIPGENSFPTLESYHRYSSQKEALQDLQKAYDLGISKRNYTRFGAEEEAAFGFRLNLDPELILAYHDTNYPTEKERTRALNAAVRFFKKYEAPVSLQKQANQYTWSISEEFKGLIQSDEEFTSATKANADFKKALLARAAQVDNEVFKPHFYHLNIESLPVNYKFLYGNTKEDSGFNPLFVSNSYFLSPETAKEAYTKFVLQLPNLDFKATGADDVAFELHKNSEEKPVAVQYQEDSYKASSEEAKAVAQYLQTVYNNNDSTPNDAYILKEMLVNREGSFGWKFFKKNDPLAMNPYRCVKRANTEEIAMTICDQVPPIDLKHCPPKEVVVCPEKDPNKFHYRICFEDKNELKFILISYAGYGSYKEAFEAWEKEWYEVLILAKNASEYGNSGKISLDENYKPADDTSCNDTSYIAVVPKANKLKLIEAGREEVTFYTTMAHLFPIYEIKKDDTSVYKFKVVVEEEGLGSTNCELVGTEIPEDDFGSLIWLGTDEYSCCTEAIKAYNHFYILAGTSQNCRILCEKGKYYVALIEVLVESFCKYTSPEEAWDDAFATIDVNGETYMQDACGDCLPGGVRSFLYASDDPKNFIPVYMDGYWTFKVVAPEYFVVTHGCNYNSEIERDNALEKWKFILKNLNWDDYLKFELNNGESESPSVNLQTNIIGTTSRFNTDGNGEERICELVFTIRKCLEDCTRSNLTNEELLPILESCLHKKYEEEDWEYSILQELDIEELLRFVTYFPIYASEGEHCYRIYWPDNDQSISKNGLQPCGCEETPVEEDDDSDTTCKAKYPFKSSKCYSCCGEAIAAFRVLCQLIEDDKYTIECTQSSEYGPYSFQIVNTDQELGYHPQRYKGYQEVLNAIEVTLNCSNDIGMHLLEHILLRPKTEDECSQLGGNENGEGGCLLPICPDYCCPIDWYPDMEKNDPCAKDYPEVINYLPGSDPYSFSATLTLPAWLKRFRTQESRNIFEQLLYKEVPALVGLNILWLGPRDMCRFEDNFRLWLAWLQDSENLCDPHEKHPSCRIADCIKELESEPPCPSLPGDNGDCNCGNEKEESIDPCCLPPETEGTLFWGNCTLQPNEPGTNDLRLLGSESGIETSNLESEAQLLAQIRKRKPVYLANVEKTEDSIKQTKSYERTVFFLNNTPTVESYLQLVDFFNQYSLIGTVNENEYLTLLQNTTWHLLDKLVLNYSNGIPENELKNLKTKIALLNEKGLTNKELDNGWNSNALGTMANAKPLKQIKNILNG